MALLDVRCGDIALLAEAAEQAVGAVEEVDGRVEFLWSMSVYGVGCVQRGTYFDVARVHDKDAVVGDDRS